MRELQSRFLSSLRLLVRAIELRAWAVYLFVFVVSAPCSGLLGSPVVKLDPSQSSIEAVLKASRTEMLSSPRQAFELAKTAETMALRDIDASKRRIGLANARWIGAEALLRLNRGSAAERLSDSALVLARDVGDRKLMADILLTRAGIFGDQVRVAKALEAYQSAYRMFAASHDNRGQAVALQSIANLYLDGQDFERADRYYQESEDAFSNDPVLLLTLYNNRATSLLQQRRFDQAISEYMKAREIARAQNSGIFQARIAENIAKARIEQKHFDEAAPYLAEALRITASPEASGWRRMTTAVAARLAFQQGRLSEAKSWIGQSFVGLDLETTSATFRDAHGTAYQIYDALGEPKLALAHLQALRRLTDEQTRLAASTNTALMAARFDFANQELRIARLKADELRASINLERSQARFQRILFLGTGAAAVVIFALLSFGVITLRRSRNRVRAANVELEVTNLALAKALAAKTEFLATTSHEIRTPLNGILGMAQVMLADRSLPDEQRDRVQLVHGAGLTMRSLVDDILDVAKMETGHLTIAPEPADLRATLEDASRMWAEQARAKGLDFTLDLDGAPRWIETDAGRVRQMVFNLLSNAIKFTAQGSIALTARKVADGSFRIEVRDSGIGIPADKLDDVFESFRQADSTTTREFGGTGLGLTICRNLARAMGGDIIVESEVGTGSTFTVTLPLVPASPPSNVGESMEDGRTLVVLERNPIARSMLKTVLSARVGKIIFVGDADELKRSLTGASHLLIDAASLGDQNASILATLSKLKKIMSEQKVAAFVLWRDPDDHVIATVSSMGGVSVIEKPIAGPALAARVFGENDTPDQPLVTKAA